MSLCVSFRISPEGVDIVLDCLCGEECNKGYALLKPMGKYILYGSSNVVTGETKSFFSAARSVRNLSVVDQCSNLSRSRPFSYLFFESFIPLKILSSHLSSVILDACLFFGIFSGGKSTKCRL